MRWVTEIDGVELQDTPLPILISFCISFFVCLFVFLFVCLLFYLVIFSLLLFCNVLGKNINVADESNKRIW